MSDSSHRPGPLRLLPGSPPAVLVADSTEPCPYLEGEAARMPVRLPLRPLTNGETDRHLEAGDRRHGRFLYRPECPACSACEALRIDLDAFAPSRSLRRTERRGDRELEVEIGPPRVDAERIALFERHKTRRGLEIRDLGPMKPDAYARFLVDRPGEAAELRLRLDDRLVGVAVTDLGETSLSAVYTYFDPDLPGHSLGTYAILRQARWGRETGRRWLYLGLYVARNRHMRYKARFLPHERRIDGLWRRSETAGG